MLNRIVRRLPGYDDLRALMHAHDTRQVCAQILAREHYRSNGHAQAVLDLGCGAGSSLSWFQELDPLVRWHGVDIEDSPEVRSRRTADPRMVSYDGTHLPYENEQFDIVFSEQVLEHVVRPHELLADVQRVLKPGGVFLGSVAYLEPYHSFSIFNFTPYGLSTTLRGAGLEPVLLRHSSDAFYKIMRQMFGGWRSLTLLSRTSLVYAAVELLGRLTGADKRDMNLLKIQYAGSICFIGRKPLPTGQS